MFLYTVTIAMRYEQRLIFKQTKIESKTKMQEKDVERAALAKVNVQARYLARVYEIHHP